MASKKEDTLVAAELRKRPEAELKSLIDSKSEELSKALFKHELKQLRDTHQLKLMKRDIARLLTVLNERQPKAQA